MRGGMRMAVVAAMAVAGLAGCGYQGLNSLSLPGTQGHGAGSYEITVQFQNMSQVVPNSDVMVDNANVGNVTGLKVQGWHAVATVRLNGNVVLPANATASIGQQSLLGAMFIALSPPAGEKPAGRLRNGDAIPLTRTSTYPSTEETLAAVSTLLNGGGLANVSVITSQLDEALGDGRTTQVRRVLDQAATLASDLNRNKGNIEGALDGLNKLGGIAVANNKLIGQTLNQMPSALGVLNTETPALVQAASGLSTLSDTATRVVNDSTEPLVRNLNELLPALKATAASGSSLVKSLNTLGSGPFPLSTWRNVVPGGDYLDLWVTLNLTNSAIQRYYPALAQGVPPQTLISSPRYQAGNPLSALLQPSAKTGTASSKPGSSSGPAPGPAPSKGSTPGGLLGILGG